MNKVSKSIGIRYLLDMDKCSKLKYQCCIAKEWGSRNWVIFLYHYIPSSYTDTINTIHILSTVVITCIYNFSSDILSMVNTIDIFHLHLTFCLTCWVWWRHNFKLASRLWSCIWVCRDSYIQKVSKVLGTFKEVITKEQQEQSQFHSCEIHEGATDFFNRGRADSE